TNTPKIQIYTLSLHDALPIFENISPEIDIESIKNPFDDIHILITLLFLGRHRKEIQTSYLIRSIDKKGLFCKFIVPCTSLHLNLDRKSTRLNSSHQIISYAVF